MKDSGVEWIGNIPQHWKKCRLKSVLRILRGSSPRPIEEYLTDSGDGINWIKIGDTDKGQKSISQTKQKIKPSGVAKSRLVRKGDLLLTNSMSFGEPYFLEIDGCIHDGWVCFTNLTNINKLFLYYFLCSEFCRIQFQLQVAGGVVQNLNIDKIGETILYLPLAKEQSAIADYLDEKCGAIDEIIEQAKATIEEYKAWKSSVIFEAVTKGLDPNVEMKDSGVEWIGQVPKHWKVAPLKRVSHIQTGNTPSKQSQENFYSDDDGIPWIKADNLGAFNSIEKTSEYLTANGAEAARLNPENTVYVCCIGTIGKTGFSTKKCACNQQINAVSFNDLIFWKFGFYSILAQEVQHWFYANGNVLKILNTENQKNIQITIPPMKEQWSIVDFLDEKCVAIDGIIAEKEALIADMEAYKKSLIFESVTGKRKVC